MVYDEVRHMSLRDLVGTMADLLDVIHFTEQPAPSYLVEIQSQVDEELRRRRDVKTPKMEVHSMKGEVCPVDKNTTCQEGHCGACVKPPQEPEPVLTRMADPVPVPVEEPKVEYPKWFSPTHKLFLTAVITEPGQRLREIARKITRDYEYCSIVANQLVRQNYLVKKKLPNEAWPRYFPVEA